MVYSQKSIGLNIRENRKKRNLSIEQLAELLDVSGSFLGLVERGQRGLGIEKLCKLTDIFNISLDDLFAEKNSYKKTIESTLVLAEPKVFKGKPENFDQLQSLLYNLTKEEIDVVIASVVALRRFSRQAGRDDE